ncbi:Acetyltransferase (GNAT) domain protein [uncultured archaeon]|nr:Acetyltransferase (GNAT) domain protein [uncultured archaeon]
MPNAEVRDLKEEEYDLWDSLVEASPHGTIFHKSFWLKASSELFDRKLKILGYFEDEKLEGGCSFFSYNNSKGVFKFAASTCGLAPYGGIVLSKHSKGKSSDRKQESVNMEVIKSLSSAINKGHFDYIEFTNSPEFNDVRPFTQNGWRSNVLYTYYLNLQEFDETEFSRDVKRNLRKAIENNLSIKKGFDLSTYYDLFSKTFEKQNMKPPVSFQYFKKIIDLLKSTSSGEMVICETASGEPASAHITLWDNKRAYSWSNASDIDFIETGSNYLLISEISKDLKNRGFKEFNLMRGNMPHLSRFAMNFNPNLLPYYEVEKSSLKLDIAKCLKTTFNRLYS